TQRRLKPRAADAAVAGDEARGILPRLQHELVVARSGPRTRSAGRGAGAGAGAGEAGPVGGRSGQREQAREQDEGGETDHSWFPGAESKSFPGLRIPAGSSAARTARITARSAGPRVQPR